MALLAEQNRDPKRRFSPFGPDDFNPYADPKEHRFAPAKMNWSILRKVMVG